jgi:hypothetical protein
VKTDRRAGKETDFVKLTVDFRSCFAKNCFFGLSAYLSENNVSLSVCRNRGNRGVTQSHKFAVCSGMCSFFV